MALSIKRQGAQIHVKPKDTQKLTTGYFIALERDEVQLHPPGHRHRLPQPVNLDKPVVQSHSHGVDSTIKRNNELPACRKGSQTQQSKQNEKAEKYSAGKGT